MTTDTVELEREVADQGSKASEGESKDSGSKSGKPASDSAEKGINWEERAKAAEAAQAAGDRNLKKLNERLSTLERDRTSREEDSKLDAEFARYTDEGIDPDKVQSFAERVKSHKTERREFVDKVTKHNESVKAHEAEQAETRATAIVLRQLYPEKDSVVKDAVQRLIKLSRGDVEVMEELVSFVVQKTASQETNESEPEPKAKRPDHAASVSSRGGRRTWTRAELREMSAEEYIRNKADIDAAERAGLIK